MVRPTPVVAKFPRAKANDGAGQAEPGRFLVLGKGLVSMHGDGWPQHCRPLAPQPRSANAAPLPRPLGAPAPRDLQQPPARRTSLAGALAGVVASSVAPWGLPL